MKIAALVISCLLAAALAAGYSWGLKKRIGQPLSDAPKARPFLELSKTKQPPGNRPVSLEPNQPTNIPPMNRIVFPTSSNSAEQVPIPVHRIAEGRFEVTHHPDIDPFLDLEIDAEITGPDGVTMTIPCFWKGDRTFAFRYSPKRAGIHRWQIRVTKGQAEISGDGSGSFQAAEMSESFPLLKLGAPVMDQSGRFLRQENGDPFFWLADSWWFGMCKRIRFPDEFSTLAADRARKGFTVIQFAIGFACDIHPYDERDANEAGHIWQPDFKTINPLYFDFTDERIEMLVRHGLVPNIVGMWGYYLPMLGREKCKKHWRYLAARYGAFPVTWTLCGESRLTWYLETDRQQNEANLREQTEGWSEVGQYLKRVDPWHRLLTCHVGPKPAGEDHPPISDTSCLDFHFLQPGHSDHDAIRSVQLDLTAERNRSPGSMILVGECCFEGMHGGAGPKTQRNLFWSSVLSGMPGYSYGVDALWQMNRAEEPFGASVGGQIWGNSPWNEAIHWAGSTGVGLGAKILSTLPWWRMEPHPEWITPHADTGNSLAPYAAGIPGQLRVFYFPTILAPWGVPPVVHHLEDQVVYQAKFINPIDGSEWPIGRVDADAKGNWSVPFAPVLHDWVLVMTAAE